MVEVVATDEADYPHRVRGFRFRVQDYGFLGGFFLRFGPESTVRTGFRTSFVCVLCLCLSRLDSCIVSKVHAYRGCWAYLQACRIPFYSGYRWLFLDFFGTPNDET